MKELFKNRRKELGITQENIAYKLGVSTQYISKIEKDFFNSSIRTKEKYIAYLFDLEDNYGNLEEILIHFFKSNFISKEYINFCESFRKSTLISFKNYIPYIIIKIRNRMVDRKLLEVLVKDIIDSNIDANLKVLSLYYQLSIYIDEQDYFNFINLYERVIDNKEFECETIKNLKYLYVIYLFEKEYFYKALNTIYVSTKEIDNYIIYVNMKIYEAIIHNHYFQFSKSFEIYSDLLKIVETRDITECMDNLLINLAFSALYNNNFELARSNALKIINYPQQNKINFILAESAFQLNDFEKGIYYYNKIDPINEHIYLKKYLNYRYINISQRNLLYILEKYKKFTYKTNIIYSYIHALKLKLDVESGNRKLKTYDEIFSYINKLK